MHNMYKWYGLVLFFVVFVGIFGVVPLKVSADYATTTWVSLTGNQPIGVTSASNKCAPIMGDFRSNNPWSNDSNINNCEMEMPVAGRISNCFFSVTSNTSDQSATGTLMLNRASTSIQFLLPVGFSAGVNYIDTDVVDFNMYDKLAWKWDFSGLTTGSYTAPKIGCVVSVLLPSGNSTTTNNYNLYPGGILLNSTSTVDYDTRNLFFGWVVFMVTFMFIIWFFRKRS